MPVFLSSKIVAEDLQRALVGLLLLVDGFVAVDVLERLLVDGVLDRPLRHGGSVDFSFVHGLFQLAFYAQALGVLLAVKGLVDGFQSGVGVFDDFESFVVFHRHRI